ncbi:MULTISPECIES: helix-turn-helix domain-containing protein [Virgibacillus]|uniref:helix-turn-helix domain-containing protein n=1 Tax=Virgibacillus TaxID=84406 RepID=UPI00098B261C|nr:MULTISPECIES: helix-turn-helix transcriptional regulator [Virgibacillus]
MKKNSPVFGNRLKFLRKQRGLKQEEVAKSLNISRARYSHYENNHVEPDIEMLKNLSRFYNVTIDYLVGNGNQNNDKDEVLDIDPELKLWYRDLPSNGEKDMLRLKKIWDVFKEE